MSAAIDLAESSYDLSQGEGEWLPNLLQTGLPIMDAALGVAGVRYTRGPAHEVVVDQIHVASGPEDFVARKARFMSEMPKEMQDALTRPGLVTTMSETTREFDGGIELFQEHFDYAKDMLGIVAFDPNGSGIVIAAPLPKVTVLSKPERLRWQKIATHFVAGHRLRENLKQGRETILPLGAEALIDPTTFRVIEAEGLAQHKSAIETLREGAIRVDRARGKLRKSDPEAALDLWTGLVDGRWSLIDHFDSDGRRYVVAKPNQPELSDPRGLTKHEQLVATYASLGESSKLIAYRLGTATSTVSTHLRSAMRKLGVKSQPQLVSLLQGMPKAEDASS